MLSEFGEDLLVPDWISFGSAAFVGQEAVYTVAVVYSLPCRKALPRDEQIFGDFFYHLAFFNVDNRPQFELLSLIRALVLQFNELRERMRGS